MLYLSSMEVNIWIGRISFQGFFKVSKTEERIFFRIWTLLDVEGCTLDQRIGSGGIKDHWSLVHYSAQEIEFGQSEYQKKPIFITASSLVWGYLTFEPLR